jgi:hypothetical protein
MNNYESIVEGWVKEFLLSMDDGILRPGDRSGVEPAGVKIIFDGYGYNEETDQQDNLDVLSFAVFVHKDSLSGEFPDHDETPWALIHRPKEEVCICVWYDANEDVVEIIPFEDGDTQLDHDLVYSLIEKIDKGEYDDNE